MPVVLLSATLVRRRFRGRFATRAVASPSIT
jgi:hypothetical protein